MFSSNPKICDEFFKSCAASILPLLACSDKKCNLEKTLGVLTSSSKLFNISFISIIYDLYPDVIVKNQILKRGNILIKFWEKINKYVFSSSKEIIVLDSVMAKKIKKKYQLYKSNINILPSFTNTKKIRPISKKENWFSRKYNPENKFIAIYSGNQGRCHDLKTIIETASILKKTTDIYFIFIGNGYQNKFLN